MYDRILVGVDGSDAAAAALHHAVELATDVDAEVHVVTVVTPPSNPMRFGVPEVEDIDQAAASLIDEVSSAHDGRDLEIVTEVRRGKPVEQLLQYAGEIDADLIVTGQRGEDGLEAVLLGSTTDRLAKLTDVPLTIVPVDDAEGS